MKTRLLLLCLFWTSLANNSWAEGSKEILPNSSDISYLLVGGTSQTHFAAYDDIEENRLYVRIGDFNNEIIHLGFNETSSGTLYYRIKDPSGNVVFGPTAVPTSAGVGYIGSYTEATTGPQAIYGGSGYQSQTFTPSMNGAYYIEFNSGSGTTFSNTTHSIQWFDVTVENTTTNAAINGRLCAKNWSMSTQAFTNSFNGAFYVYTTDSVVTLLDMNGFTPYVFSINCNSYGVTNTGNLITDRMSVSGQSVAPEYCLFLNDPDASLFPSSIPAEVSATPPTITGCIGNYCVNAEFSKGGVAEVILDLDGNTGYQSGTADILLAEYVSAGVNCFNWDGLDGLGNTVTSGSTIAMIVTIQNGYTNFPVFDAECNPNGYNVSLVRPVGSQPPLYWDDSNIGGTTETAGCLTNCHTWGGGACSGSSFGNQVTINTYWYGVSDTKSFSVVVPGCPPVAIDDTETITENTSVTSNVSINDTDLDNDIVAASVAIVTGSPNGATATPDGFGGIIYTPATDFTGIDSVIYEICDATNLCDTATLVITVNPR